MIGATNATNPGARKGTFEVIDTMGFGLSGTFPFELGMTWEEFVNSSYNIGLYINGAGSVCMDSDYGELSMTNFGVTTVRAGKDYPIQNGGVYEFVI